MRDEIRVSRCSGNSKLPDSEGETYVTNLHGVTSLTFVTWRNVTVGGRNKISMTFPVSNIPASATAQYNPPPPHPSF